MVRVEISERFDLITPNLRYVEALAVASPAVPHFAVVASDPVAVDSGSTASHMPSHLPVFQAPVLCQMCEVEYISQANLLEHAKAARHA